MSVGRNNMEDAVATLRWASAHIVTIQVDVDRLASMVRTALNLLDPPPAEAAPAKQLSLPLEPSNPD